MVFPPRRLAWRLIQVREFLRFTCAARWIAIACTACFVVQRVTDRVSVMDGLSFGTVLQLAFGLCPALLFAGFVWQVVTYMFLHGSVAHLLLNMLTLLLFGSGLEMEIGAARFLRTFFLGGAAGGLMWAGFDVTTVHLAQSLSAPEWLQALAQHATIRRGTTIEGAALCIGASGGVFALIGAFAALFPTRTVILFLGWPVKLKARTVAVLLGVGTVAFAVYGLGNVAYVAHLFGGLAGYLYGLRLARQGWGEGHSRQSMVFS